jgi:hypothetical protein
MRLARFVSGQTPSSTSSSDAVLSRDIRGEEARDGGCQGARVICVSSEQMAGQRRTNARGGSGGGGGGGGPKGPRSRAFPRNARTAERACHHARTATGPGNQPRGARARAACVGCRSCCCCWLQPAHTRRQPMACSPKRFAGHGSE